jgi:anti-sigma regulatory factor (Ser/Thr protein kinase)
VSCAHLDYVSSGHIGLLWAARQSCLETGARLTLSDVPASMARVLRVLDLEEVLGHSETGTTMAVADDVSRRQATSGTPWELTIRPGEFSEGLRRYLSCLEAWGLSGDVVFELRSVFYEVVQNIIAYSGQTDGDVITVRGRLSKTPPHAPLSGDSTGDFADRGRNGLAMLTFIDAGVPFDPTRAPVQSNFQAAARERRHRGFGLAMIRKLTDRIEYQRAGNENVLTIEKQVR